MANRASRSIQRIPKRSTFLLSPPVGGRTLPSGIPLTGEISGRWNPPFPTQPDYRKADAHAIRLPTTGATIICQPHFLISITLASTHTLAPPPIRLQRRHGIGS